MGKENEESEAHDIELKERCSDHDHGVLTSNRRDQQINLDSDKTLTSHQQCHGYPKHVLLIVCNEFCERFSYYGMRAVLILYIVNILGYNHSDSVALYHAFSLLCYTTPIFGSILADGYIGKYHVVDFIGLITIAIGTGGIKPCVSAFGGDQFKTGQERWLETFFSIFYFSINAGSVISAFVSPMFRVMRCLGQDSCYPLAFGLPAALMILSIVFFVIGTNRYTRIPPKENVIAEVIRVIYAQFVEDIKAVLRICVMFLPVPVFWALFNLQGSRWILQGIAMDGTLWRGVILLPDQIGNVNAIMIMVFIPIFQGFVYPMCRKIGINPTCKQCFRRVKREKLNPPDNHGCGKIKCAGCFEIVDPNKHFCTITRDKKPQHRKHQIFVFADFECYRDAATLEHRVNLAVAHVTCEKCINDFDLKDYPCCPEGRERIFKGENCLQNFCSWLFFQEELKTAVTFFHYGGRYDCILILGNLLRRVHFPKIISKGTRILMLTAGKNVAVKDSYSLIPLPLEKLPKAFDLDISSKLFFPYGLCDKPNPFGTKKIPFPNQSYFYPENMSEVRKEQFTKWYEGQVATGEMFDYEKEYLEYCRTDVRILHQALAKLRHNMMQMAGDCPLSSSYTLPQYVGKVFRNTFLSEDFQVPLLSDVNTKLSYLKRKQSREAIQYFNYLNVREKIDIKHAGNSTREHKIGTYYVDGFEERTNTIYEYNGCFTHGHYKCQKNRFHSKHPLFPGLTFSDVYSKTMIRKNELEQMGHTVKMFWSCEVLEETDRNLVLKKIMTDQNLFSFPIQSCRECLFGGRTNNVALLCQLTHEDIQNGWKINFVDINSLYPFSMRYKKYPCGRHIILTGHDIPKPFGLDEAKKLNGIIRCRIVPPDQLYFPVLPMRHPETSGICFPLCKTCAMEANHEKECTHEDPHSRGWIGTYCTPEIVAALERGYTIDEVFEVWDFPRMEHIFEDYMKKFSAIKYANSGYPSYVETKKEKQMFLADLKQVEGIELKPEEVKSNECLKNLSKLMMNSLFGKFAQNPAKTSDQVKYTNSAAELRKMIRNPNTDITNVEIYEDVVMVQTKKKEAELTVHKLSNPIISAFITCYSRLHLLESLDKLDIRVLYLDTDSIIWLARDTDHILPEISPFFGDFKNELEEDDYIVDFVAIAPKTYAFRTAKGRSVVKAKGLCLKQKHVDSNFDFDAMAAILLNKVDDLKKFYSLFPECFVKRKMIETARNYDKKNRKGAPPVPGAATVLALPDAKLRRTRTGVILEDKNRCKIVRVIFNKRQLFVPACSKFTPKVTFSSLPWGSRLGAVM